MPHPHPWLAAALPVTFATATLISALAAEAAGGYSALPILLWLVMPLLLGAASIAGAVCIDILWRGGRRSASLETQKSEE